jgi:uncharacterized protein YgbK (DUF1537 family)
VPPGDDAHAAVAAQMLIGCIADDFTGATDLAVNIAREGLSVIQVNGIDHPAQVQADIDVVVVALKSRTVPPHIAIEQSLKALAFLQKCGAPRIYFKYCSTFDSTPRGNIGPVTASLQRALGAQTTPATPAYPRNRRTVYCGHLFIGDSLLSDTDMRFHPLTPMTDSSLVRLLAAQVSTRVGTIDVATLDAGVSATAGRLRALQNEAHGHAIVDATRDEHLFVAGQAFAELPLSTGGAGLAMGLARALRSQARPRPSPWIRPDRRPRTAWLAGSCSSATRRQVEKARTLVPSIHVDPIALARDDGLSAVIASQAVAASGESPVLVYATAEADAVAAAQAALGAAKAATLIEDCFGRVAHALRDAGTQAFVIAGGETCGAVVEYLGVHALTIGPEIDAGVPWTRTIDGDTLWFALKSGNFGSDDFFNRATAML